MNSIRVKILFVLSLSILFTYAGILYINFEKIPDIIPTHINFQGEIDGYGNKIQLWFLVFTNLFLVTVLYIVSRLPRYWNVPFKPQNEITFRKKVRLLLGILSVILTCAFSTMIFYTLGYTFVQVLKLLISILIIPILFIIFLKKIKHT